MPRYRLPAAPETAKQVLWQGVLAATIARQRAPRVAMPAVEDHGATLAMIRSSFEAFLPYWSFVDRESGEIRTFAELWEGQQMFARATADHPMIIALKAGKLGFTELECAYDAWTALFRASNARVHLFSKDATASAALLEIVKFGIRHLPDWMRLPILADEPGGDTTKSFRMRAGQDDIRTIASYAAGANVSIDQSCQHAHVDELARMPFALKTYSAVYSTIAPGGTLHIVSRGAGEDNYMADLWVMAVEGRTGLYPLFADYTKRPGRDSAWREKLDMTGAELRYYAPETPEDALTGDEENEFVDIAAWDMCRADVPTADELRRTRAPVVLAADAAVSNDCFGILGAIRHPEQARRTTDVLFVLPKKWTPPHGGHIDFHAVESYIRWVCRGGCVMGHPADPKWQDAGCGACASADPTDKVAGLNVVQLTYDAFQFEDMAQSLMRDGIVWCDAFSQAGDRLEADGELRRAILKRALGHDGNAEVREHIGNARAKVYPDEDSKIRIIKRAPHRKIDLAVCASMARKRCLSLNL